MSSIELYEGIHVAAIERLRRGAVEIDPVLARGGGDDRRGISLILTLRPPVAAYRGLVQAFSAIDGRQCYYPYDDLHVTVFDFVPAFVGYRRDEGFEASCLEVSREAAEATGAFNLRLEGVVFSPAAGLVQGFDGDRLIRLREGIRAGLASRGMRNDERYRSESAHATFTRFREGPADPGALCGLIEAWRKADLGSQAVGELELVEHDWYNSLGSKRAIGKIQLREF